MPAECRTTLTLVITTRRGYRILGSLLLNPYEKALQESTTHLAFNLSQGPRPVLHGYLTVERLQQIDPQCPSLSSELLMPQIFGPL